jgi:hypothetical protein
LSGIAVTEGAVGRIDIFQVRIALVLHVADGAGRRLVEDTGLVEAVSAVTFLALQVHGGTIPGLLGNELGRRERSAPSAQGISEVNPVRRAPIGSRVTTGTALFG